MAKIGLDVDGVLANYHKPFADILFEVSGKKHWDGNETPKYWHWDIAYGWTKEESEETWRRVRSSDSFWRNCPVTEFINGLALEMEHDVYFITNRSGVRVKWQTEMWLRENLKVLTPTVLIAEDKGPIIKSLKLDIFVDDRAENIQSAEYSSPETLSVLINKPYNMGYRVKTRANTAKEALGLRGINV